MYQSIIDMIRSESPTLVYIAIGCALGHYPDDDYPEQQNPPFIRDYPSSVRILIDPLLESPPRSMLQEDNSRPFEKIGAHTIIPLRKMFDFRDNGDDKFMKALYEICLRSGMKLIVQDYSGTDIRPFYPAHNKYLHGLVLFDATYGDGNCFPDLDEIQLIKDSAGDFIQPSLSPLSRIHGIVSKNIFAFEFKFRTDALVTYIQRFYRIQMSLEEVRDWCTEQHVSSLVRKLALIYNTGTDNTDPANLRLILIEAALDLHRTASAYISRKEIEAIVDECFDSYSQMVKLMKALFDI